MKLRYSYQNEEFNAIVRPIITDAHFQGLKQIAHHGVTRYDHSMRVAYYSYWLTKLLHLNYQEATRGAMMHDFFYDREEKNKREMLLNHPKFAKEMAESCFGLTALEEDVILSHMFPVAPRVPRYLESWIVDFVDDCAGIYEKAYSVRKQLSHACSFLILFVMVVLSK